MELFIVDVDTCLRQEMEMSTMRQNVAFSDATAAAQHWHLVHG